jgi:hypothetical protein
LKVGEGVRVWIDQRTLAALDTERGAGEGYSEVILRLVEVGERGHRIAINPNCVTSIIEIESKRALVCLPDGGSANIAMSLASERRAFISGRSPI